MRLFFAEVLVNGVLRENLTTGVEKVVQLSNATIQTSATHLSVVLECGFTLRSALVEQSLSIETLLTPDYKGRVTGKPFARAVTMRQSQCVDQLQSRHLSFRVCVKFEAFNPQVFSVTTMGTLTTICEAGMAPNNCL